MKQPTVLPKPAFNKREAARILGISEVTLSKIIAEKRLRAFRPTSTSVRILPADLEAFIDANATN